MSEENALRSFLDTYQIEAVTHRGSNLLIIAGAGSGKTRTLTSRALSFLKEFNPENLMAITFTKKAANELATRIRSGIPEGSIKNELRKAWIGTIHSICWRILQTHWAYVGLKQNWSVLDSGDAFRVMRLSAKPYGIFEEREIKDVLLLNGYAKNSMVDWKELLRSPRFPNLRDERKLEKVLDGYQRRCIKSNRVDFDDLLILTHQVLNENYGIRESFQERFKAIFVDEYQDTSIIQASFLKLLDCPNNNITVVGDDAQSIYGFRAASIENILNFEEHFNAKRIILHNNYRSTPEIVNLANDSIRKNSNQLRKDILSVRENGQKPFFYCGETINDEAKFVAKTILNYAKNGVPLKNQAVLFRATKLSASLVTELKNLEIPFTLVGGDDFFELEHIKLIIDMCRLIINSEDAIALSAIQEFLGFSSSRTLEHIEATAFLSQLTLWDVAQETAINSSIEMRKDIQELFIFLEMVSSLKHENNNGLSVNEIIIAIIEKFSQKLKEKFSSFWEEILSDFSILQTIASQYTSIEDFVNSISLEQFVKEDGDNDQNLILSTLHSAKGLEWDNVFLIGLVEFWFPLKFSIAQTGSDEEERRLFYVGLTRAKSELILTSYSKYLDWDGDLKPQQISRFFREIDPELVTEVKDKKTLDFNSKLDLVETNFYESYQDGEDDLTLEGNSTLDCMDPPDERVVKYISKDVDTTLNDWLGS